MRVGCFAKTTYTHCLYLHKGFRTRDRVFVDSEHNIWLALQVIIPGRFLLWIVAELLACWFAVAFPLPFLISFNTCHPQKSLRSSMGHHRGNPWYMCADGGEASFSHLLVT